MRKGCHTSKGTIALCFALGLLVACFCPPRFLIAVLAVWVIVLALTKPR